MGTYTGFRLLRMLTALCVAIAVSRSVTDRAIAAAETASARMQMPTTTCPHPVDKDGNRLWKPTDSQLHRIVARHFGYLAKKYLPADDLKVGQGEYLDQVTPAFPDWRDEALKNPEKANLCNADLRGAGLSGALLIEADLSNADFTKADLRGAYLSGANLNSADLSNADLSHAKLRDANLRDATLNGADLSGVELVSADLRNAALAGADLSDAQLNSANLSDAQLRSAKLLRAQLTDAKAMFADFRFANLTGADLSKADLKYANLSDANLSDATLNAAALNGTDLYRADLSKAAGVTDRIVAATQNPTADRTAASCPHPLDEYGRQIWEPTPGKLNRILARHRGWLQQETRYRMKLEAPDAYLDNDVNAFGEVKPAFTGWRREAQEHPEKATLCNAWLNVAILTGAILVGADLRNAVLVSAELSGTHLGDADLRGADLSDTNLRDTYLGMDFSDAMKAMPIGFLFSFPGADLRNANLREADLKGADLRRSKLSGADLRGAKLTCVSQGDEKQKCVNLTDVDLTGANLETYSVWPGRSGHGELLTADLSGAYLYRAKLSSAKLSGANLENAKLNGADLSRAELTCVDAGDLGRRCTNLRGANLSRAQVSKARLDHVDLTEAVYAPVSESPDPYVAGIQGLATLSAAQGDEIGLVQLRKLFRDAGLGDSEREVTFSIQRNVTKDQLSSQLGSLAWINGLFRYIGFGWTTAYGLYPERALVGILSLGIILTPVYMLFVMHPMQKGQIVAVFPEDRIDIIVGDSAGKQERKKLIKAKNWWSALGWASYFSLLSAVNIGFEQFTPGDWIRRLQGRDYSLQAVGWLRSIAGVQALVSVYLLAMWVLTQFGRPFG